MEGNSDGLRFVRITGEVIHLNEKPSMMPSTGPTTTHPRNSWPEHAIALNVDVGRDGDFLQVLGFIADDCVEVLSWKPWESSDTWNVVVDDKSMKPLDKTNAGASHGNQAETSSILGIGLSDSRPHTVLHLLRVDEEALTLARKIAGESLQIICFMEEILMNH